MEEKILEKIDKLYEESKEICGPDAQFEFCSGKIKDKEKRHFFSYVCDYFLKRRQEEVIANEKY